MDEAQRNRNIAFRLSSLLNYLSGFDRPEDFTAPYVRGLNELKAEAAEALKPLQP